MIGLFVPAIFQQLTILGTNRQMIIGTIVNATLIACALKIKDPKKIVALSVLPSISSMTTGILFNGLTLYSKVMLPFIWIGNLALILGIKFLLNKTSLIPASVASIVVKVGIIYGGFRLMSAIMKFPPKINTVFSTTFGITQVYTATLGLVLVLTIMWIKKMRDE
jgi:hypothetical protein